MTALGLIAVALVAAQLLITLIFQFRPLSERFAMLDLLGIVPRWKFFAQEQGRYDIAIEFRASDAGETPGAWRAVWTPAPRSRWSWLWRANGLRDGVVWLAATTLDARIAAGKPACPETSAAYAAILDLCRRDGGAGAGQFALVRLTPGGERRVRFTSAIHTF